MATYRKRTLIVDDDRMSRALFEAHLNALGFDCVFAHDGDEAIEVLSRDTGFDLIITDVMMPYGTGFDFTKALKADARTRDIPLLASSAFHDWKKAREARDLPVDGFIPKPVNRQALQREILRLVHR